MPVSKTVITKRSLSVSRPAIVEPTVRKCLNCGVSQSVLVLGHRSDQIKRFVDDTFRDTRVNYVINEQYHDTNTGYVLMLASSPIETANLVTFSRNVVFETQILRQHLDIDIPVILCGDCNVMLAHPKVKVMQVIRWL